MMMMTWKGFGRKRSGPNFKVLEGLRKPTKNLNQNFNTIIKETDREIICSRKYIFFRFVTVSE
jgi:hypothetical protein